MLREKKVHTNCTEICLSIDTSCSFNLQSKIGHSYHQYCVFIWPKNISKIILQWVLSESSKNYKRCNMSRLNTLTHITQQFWLDPVHAWLCRSFSGHSILSYILLSENYRLQPSARWWSWLVSWVTGAGAGRGRVSPGGRSRWRLRPTWPWWLSNSLQWTLASNISHLNLNNINDTKIISIIINCL